MPATQISRACKDTSQGSSGIDKFKHFTHHSFIPHHCNMESGQWRRMMMGTRRRSPLGVGRAQAVNYS